MEFGPTAPLTVASVVRRFGRSDVHLDRVSRGITALLLESFDDLAGLALGVDAWMPSAPQERYGAACTAFQCW